MSDHVQIVQYQGDFLIVPTDFGYGDVFAYVKAGLKVCPAARKILWNDRVRKIEVSGESFKVEL